MKKLIYILSAIVLCALVGFRIYSISEEKSRDVFNPARMDFVPVETIVMQEKLDTLKEPIFIKNNSALVSGNRVYKFGVGQHIGDGRIVSISSKIDLDSGMHIIKTNDAKDGLQFAESNYTGFFVPLFAIQNNIVMVAEDGIAKPREVKIVNTDSEKAFITRGLQDGDVVILSKVTEGEKVK